jgi:adenylosuccinate synthase
VIGKCSFSIDLPQFRATLTTNIHRKADGVSEQRKVDQGKPVIGTTLQGIGPSYASKILRFGLRVGDLRDWDEFV